MNINEISDVFFDEIYHSFNDFGKTKRNSSKIG